MINIFFFYNFKWVVSCLRLSIANPLNLIEYRKQRTAKVKIIVLLLDVR